MSGLTIRIDHSNTDYPKRLRDKGFVERYPSLSVVGNVGLLDRPLLGLLCSLRCPGQVILRTHDLARALRDAAVPVIGGFHSPMEKECLDLLLRGAQPVIICPARSLDRMRVSHAWQSAIDAQRVVVISPFIGRHQRITAALAQQRNGLVGALANEVMVLHATPGRRIDRLCRELVADGSTVGTPDLPDNDSRSDRQKRRCERVSRIRNREFRRRGDREASPSRHGFGGRDRARADEPEIPLVECSRYPRRPFRMILRSSETRWVPGGRSLRRPQSPPILPRDAHLGNLDRFPDAGIRLIDLCANTACSS